MLAILIGVIIGIGLPMQTSINTRLKVTLNSPFLASLTSFTIGTIFLAIMTLFIDHSLLFKQQLFTSQPIWLWIGGLLGVIYLTSNILLFPKLGSVQTVIFPILGQIVMGLIIDNFSLFDSAYHKMNAIRFAGALLVILGVICTVAMPNIIAKLHGQLEVTPKAKGIFVWRLLGIIAGMLGACQTAINGHLGVILKSSVKAAFISFFVGTIALILVNLILRPKLRFITPTNGKNPWWMWLGGLIGALFVFGNAFLVPIIGTGLAVVIILIGQMTGSLLVDEFGLLESQKNPISFIQIIGIVIMILGVGLIRLV